ncbi:MAG: glycosyltransferase, partial [Lachnospiraceae bacterium]|nr:glycosyltransferase [Lachnospiraceae bacterium]
MSLISVIVPIYNVERYVSQAIESLLYQDGCELEIILVDDGSTDKSGEIAQQYADQHDNIVCIHQKNQGLSAARNTGIDHAHGDYIMFLDSDDTFKENSIALLEREMEENRLDLLLFSGKKVFESGKEEVFGPQIMVPVSKGRNIYQKLRDTDNYYTCVVFMMLRRRFLIEKNIQFTEGVLHEDHVFAFRVMMTAEKVLCISDVV